MKSVLISGQIRDTNSLNLFTNVDLQLLLVTELSLSFSWAAIKLYCELSDGDEKQVFFLIFHFYRIQLSMSKQILLLAGLIFDLDLLNNYSSNITYLPLENMQLNLGLGDNHGIVLVKIQSILANIRVEQAYF